MLFALTSLYTGGPKSAPEKDLGPHASYVSQARSADSDPDLLRAVNLCGQCTGGRQRRSRIRSNAYRGRYGDAPSTRIWVSAYRCASDRDRHGHTTGTSTHAGRHRGTQRAGRLSWLHRIDGGQRRRLCTWLDRAITGTGTEPAIAGTSR